MPTKPYVIRQGDHLAKLAFGAGCSPEEIWKHPDNEALVATRGDGSQLRAGDVLRIPDAPRKRLPFRHEVTNAYVAAMPTMPLQVRVGSVSHLLADEPYRIEGLGEEVIEGRSSADGLIKLQVPIDQRELTLILPERDERFRVMVGNLDPIDDPSGLRMRLCNLGYYGTTVAGEDSHAVTEEGQLRAALLAFQAAADLPPSGDLDDATRDMLIQAHGS
jgi:hypothetical protein